MSSTRKHSVRLVVLLCGYLVIVIAVTIAYIHFCTQTSSTTYRGTSKTFTIKVSEREQQIPPIKVESIRIGDVDIWFNKQ